ncbi:MAG TPA: cytochrome c biogenesis protein CcsA [Tepidisphaeraceae bacterium]|nr:cytochrome c biogenesis protein CcsA [Tepidisphaeraceae bacterium]
MPRSLFVVLAAFFSLALISVPPARASTIDAAALDALRPLPVLDNGRIKPFDTVARETVRKVTGYEYFGTVSGDDDAQEMNGSIDPDQLVLDWAANPEMWTHQPIVYVSNPALRARLNMKPTQQWTSPYTIETNADFRTWVIGVEAQRQKAQQAGERVTYAHASDQAMDDDGLDLEESVILFNAASDLSLYCVHPTTPDNWETISQIIADPSPELSDVKTDWANLMDAYSAGDSAKFAAAAISYRNDMRAISGTQYADFSKMNLEVFYNWFKPFRKAWIIYLAAVAMLIASLMIRLPAVYYTGMAIMAFGILFHIGAFVIRCMITGWAPVATMYETLIWVSLMAAVFSYVLELIYQRRTVAIGGAVIAILAAIVADAIPPHLGKSIEPIQPVLRSNYWLSIHVLTIVSSYAAFALSMILGNILLGQFIWGRSKPETIRSNLLFTYRAVQIGVLLIAAGTILGGLWADVSWGKFWSWDPKEVWALICLLVYVALLHGRFAGWIKQFGMAAGAVLAFTAVLMSWYGVNFMLGVGLHSYGRGTGGQAYVYSFVAAEWIYVGLAWIIYRARRMGGKSADSDSLQTTAGSI